jgi:GNAT superfamily N-acetyltransferase
MSNVVVRDAELSDISTIVDFQIAMAMETEQKSLDRAICTAGVQAVFEDSARGRYFVADLGGRVVASLLITYEWSDWRNGNFWWLQSVFVSDNARGHGVFRTMFDHVRDRAARDSTVCGLRLYVDQRNARAQEVYRRLGMNGDHYQVFEWFP